MRADAPDPDVTPTGTIVACRGPLGASIGGGSSPSVAGYSIALGLAVAPALSA